MTWPMKNEQNLSEIDEDISGIVHCSTEAAAQGMHMCARATTTTATIKGTTMHVRLRQINTDSNADQDTDTDESMWMDVHKDHETDILQAEH